ncbi:MAG: hypothetical protein DMF65_10575 [Acidobacteria bacterium]|nr:MAG: hypothetical protein DMF65_10575 [Acidobacteriota bacterium]
METLSDKGNLTGVVTERAAPHVPPQVLAPRLVEIARAFRAKPFVPHKLFRSGHAQTIVATRRLPRYKSLRGERGIFEPRLVEVEPGARVLIKCRWQADRSNAPTLLLIHGLEGSSESLYMRGTAQKAFRKGFNVVRMNMRNCGDTEHLSRTLYHSGMTGDIHSVLTDELAGREGLSEIYVAGFSMSGNMVLRLVGDYGDEAPRALAHGLPLELPTQPAPTRPKEEPSAPGTLRRARPLARAHAATVRRALHSAARRLPRRRRLLRARKLAPRHRAHTRADAHHPRVGRPHHPLRAVQRPFDRRQPRSAARPHRARRPRRLRRRRYGRRRPILGREPSRRVLPHARGRKAKVKRQKRKTKNSDR